MLTRQQSDSIAAAIINVLSYAYLWLLYLVIYAELVSYGLRPGHQHHHSADWVVLVGLPMAFLLWIPAAFLSFAAFCILNTQTEKVWRYVWGPPLRTFELDYRREQATLEAEATAQYAAEHTCPWVVSAPCVDCAETGTYCNKANLWDHLRGRAFVGECRTCEGWGGVPLPTAVTR